MTLHTEKIMKAHAMRVTIPEELVAEAKRMGMSESEIRNTVETFSMLQLVSLLSKLTRKDAEEISRRVKWAAWKKLKTKLKR